MGTNQCGFYIHIPFCKQKCLYCDFPSYAHLEDLIDPYIEALKKEIQFISLKYPNTIIETIFIGGGTPTYINGEHIVDIIKTVQDCFKVEKNAEISIEGNPGTFDEEKLKKYREVGMNRLSIGLQTWQDHLLKRLGRIHTQNQFVKAVEDAKAAGFENINVDLMFGLPEQKMKDWQETLENVVSLQPTHLSCYSLIIEEETPFYDLYQQGKLQIDEDLEREMYYYTKMFLGSKAFNHYEISNFAKAGFECKHNLIYWDVKPYIGVGSSAHSFMQKHRSANVEDVKEYIKLLSENHLPMKDSHKVNQKQFMQEYMFLGMRKTEGVSRGNFFDFFGEKIEKVYEEELIDLRQKGLIQGSERIFLTSKGLDFANYVFQSFL